MITLKCSVCGNEFKRDPSRIRGAKNPSCSRECYRQGEFIGKANKGKSPTALTRKRLSDARIGKRLPNMANIKNTQWKGDAASYKAIHQWLRRNFGIPTRCEFESFGKEHSERIEYALIRGKSHTHNRACYLTLCVLCHRRYDETGKWQKKGKIQWAKRILQT